MSDLKPGGESITKEINDAIRKYMAEAKERHHRLDISKMELSGALDKVDKSKLVKSPEFDPGSAAGLGPIIKPDYNPELFDRYMKINDKFDYDYDMRPAPENIYHDDDQEIDMRPAQEFAYHDDDPEMDMTPAQEFASYDVEPEMDMIPAKQFTSPTISLVEFKTKYPSFFDEKGNIKTEALEIIDGLLDMFFKTKKGDTDTQHIEREYIVKPPVKNEPDHGPKFGM